MESYADIIMLQYNNKGLQNPYNCVLIQHTNIVNSAHVTFISSTRFLSISWNSYEYDIQHCYKSEFINSNFVFLQRL